MTEAIDISKILMAILPFIFGIIALALIPSKQKIINKKIKKFRAEILLLVYMIAFFILAMGIYFFMAVFGDGVPNLNLYLFNGLFLGIIGLGIMGLNYRNYSLFSEMNQEGKLDDSVSVSPATEVATEVAEVAEVTEVAPLEPEPYYSSGGKLGRVPEKPKPSVEPETLECPNCNSVITISVPTRPLKIKCPHCGIEGIIR